MKIVSRDGISLDTSIYNNGATGNENYGNYLDRLFYLGESNNRYIYSFNERKKKALIRLVKKIVEENFTERQKQIFFLKVEAGLSQKDIANKLHINASTVSRSLKSSQKKIMRVYDYYISIKDLFVEG